MSCTLKKTEILRNGAVLDSLFASPHTPGRHVIYVPPFKCVFLIRKSADPTQILFAVPKRNFKRAVTRNLIRRRMREAYRQSKQTLLDAAMVNGVSVAVHLCYYSSEIADYQTINNGIQKVVTEIADMLAGWAD